MAFTTVPINVAGPSYQHRSRPLSSQSTINFYQEFDESGKSPFTLQSFPGQKLFAASSGIDRGQNVMREVLFRVAGSRLQEISKSGVITDRGEITGAERCVMANDGVNLFIVHAGLVQQYSSSTELLTFVTDPDIVGSNAVDFLNNQFVYTKPDLFVISDVGNGASASGLNAAQAESQPDDLIRAYVFGQLVYMLGERSTEVWYNSGTGSPPFVRIETQIISIGIAALHSVSNNDSFMYWLGDDRQVYRAAGGRQVRITSIAIAHAIEGYSTVDDAIGWTMTIEGQNFYILTFPTENQTWALNEGLGSDGWFQLSAGLDGGRYQANSHSWVYGKHLVSHETSGNVLELDLDTFTNNGEIIKRTRVLGSISGEKIGARGKRLQMSRFELILESGVGLISGQGEDPIIIIEASYDGGKSFAAETFMKIGRLGETNIRAEWWGLQSFYDLIIRITTSDPVHYTLQSAAIDLRLAGR